MAPPVIKTGAGSPSGFHPLDHLVGRFPPPKNLQAGVPLMWGLEQQFGACLPARLPLVPAATWGASSSSPTPAQGGHPHPSEEGQPAAHRPPRGPLLAATATRQEPGEDPRGWAGSVRGGATRPAGGFQGASTVCRIQDGLSGPSRRRCVSPKTRQLGGRWGHPLGGRSSPSRETCRDQQAGRGHGEPDYPRAKPSATLELTDTKALLLGSLLAPQRWAVPARKGSLPRSEPQVSI